MSQNPLPIYPNFEESKVTSENLQELFSLKEGSEEYIKYTSELALKSKVNNTKSLCLKCRCFLSSKQKEKHLPEHNNARDIFTPSQYSSTASFKKLAILHGRARTIDGVLYIQPIILNPEPHMQIKASNKTKKIVNDVDDMEENKEEEMETLISEFEPKAKMQKTIDPFLEKEQPIQINLRAKIF